MRIPRLSEMQGDVFLAETDAAGDYAVRLPRGDYSVMIADDDAAGSTPFGPLDRDRKVDVVAERLNPRNRPAPDEVVGWVKKNALPLSTAEAGHGTGDLEPLAGVVGSARVVALGEATHGTREFFQMKHRVLEFLVEKMGFRTFAIEGSFAEAMLADEYVRTGKGDPYAAVSAMGFWTWDTEEVVEMLRWMRRYNEAPAHKEKLRFFGFDMQGPAGSVAAVAAALGAIDAKLWTEVAADLEVIDDDWNVSQIHAAAGRGEAPDPRLERAGAAARKVVARLNEERAADVKKLGAEPLALARIHAHVALDFVEMVRKGRGDFGVRDRAMAENVLRLLAMRGAGAKMVVWAHNGHVQRLSMHGRSTMGEVLSSHLRGELAVFGFAFDQGAFQAMDAGKEARGLVEHTVGPAPAGSFDGTLARAGVPLFALDLRTAAGAVRQWLDTPTYSRSIGALFDTAGTDAYLDLAPPAKLYDSVIFVEKTTAARSTPAWKRPPQKAKTPPRPALANGGFEVVEAGAPAEWSVDGYPRNLRFKATVMEKGAAEGKRAVTLEREATSMKAGTGSLAQGFDAAPLRGKHVRLTAMTKVEAKGIGDEVYLTMRVQGEATREWSVQVPASKGWTPATLEVDVPVGAARVSVAVIVTGAAKAGVDDVRIAIEGSN